MPRWYVSTWKKSDPLVVEHECIRDLVAQIGDKFDYRTRILDPSHTAGARIRDSKGAERVRFARAFAAQLRDMYAREAKGKRVQNAYAFELALESLLRSKLPTTANDLQELIEWAVEREGSYGTCRSKVLATTCESHSERHGLEDRHLELIAVWRGNFDRVEIGSDEANLTARLDALLGVSAALRIESGEAWSDLAISDISAMPSNECAAWSGFLEHCGAASGGKPVTKWLDSTRSHLRMLGESRFVELTSSWFASVGRGRTAPARPTHGGVDAELMLNDRNADYLKGLAWCGAALEGEQPDFARALSALAVSAYKKVPGVGPRCVKLGNACVWSLGQMNGLHGVGQLAYLKSKVRFGTARLGIEKAYVATGERLGLSPSELTELGIPAYGLTEVGRGEQRLGDFTAELVVTGTTDCELRWIRPDGKRQKSAPESVKEACSDELKALKSNMKDLLKMLPAQRDRIDGMFLERREWSLATWHERYLMHPVVGSLARRLVWRIEFDGDCVDAMYRVGELRTVDDVPIDSRFTRKDAKVRLWHPIFEQPAGAVVAWREYLTRFEITQPFKQVHREVYLLTDAERATGNYSNRFAAHVLKQHQFNALCAARGWSNKLRLLVDAVYPPAHRALPEWGLRAEYWIEGLGEEHQLHTNDMGVFSLVSTDQVRFFRLGDPMVSAHASGGGYSFDRGDEVESMAVEQVPPIVLSEILRDVDLFVGVASVGNDPQWQDGGREVVHREYWRTVAFGDLGATALTRKTVLEELIPKLAIADRCSFDGKFLVVRGERRTYKIHLGSSNILMAPSDTYLCIVPTTQRGAAADVFLPFEGDRMLALVLSKAFMLANDASITDRTILSQISV